MKIIQLHAENVKKIRAIDVRPGDAPVVTIGGKNGAGKSSALDCIAYALGGMDLVPSEPIRKGESEAKIEIDLGDLHVTRTFARRTQKMKTADGNEVEVEAPFSSTLVVRNKDGVKQGTPQAILDKILGTLTFDPLEFATASPKAQLTTLQKLVGIDLSLFESQRSAAFSRRTELNKKAKELEARIKSLPYHEDAPPEPIKIEEVQRQMTEADSLRKIALKAEVDRSEAERRVENVKKTIRDLGRRAQELENELKLTRDSIETYSSTLLEAEATLIDLTRAHKEATEAVPSIEVLTKRVQEIQVSNEKYNDNVRRGNHVIALKEVEEDIAVETEAIDNAVAARRKALEEARYPVPGLGLTEDGVTFNGLPLDQASTAELLKISVAIGLALNPTLKVLLIKRGNDLDSISLKALAEQAAQADAQVWMEKVSETKEGVSVLIADGEMV